MDLLDACMSGLVLSSITLPEPKPLDFVLVVNGQSVAMEANWWIGDWGKDEHLYVFDDEFTPEPVPANQQPGRWVLPDDPMNLTVPDGDTQVWIDRARERIDTLRGEYLAQLDALAANLSSDYTPMINDWRERIRKRPEITPQTVIDKLNSTPRDVGRVFLNDENGKIDVLVVDERGDAVVLNDNSWLESFADAWMDREDERPSVSDFISWIMERRPPTAQTLDGPVVEQSTGPLISIAERAFGLTA